jgi:hypothetical protein
MEFLLLLGTDAAHAQVVLRAAPSELTAEAYANLTAGAPVEVADSSAVDHSRFDGGARVLARSRIGDGPDLGVRLVVEARAADLDLAEASVLVFGGHGRLEIGERPGLPDVLTGYAPNNFQFTSAEFGPASGPGLDPGGGLERAFLPEALAMRLGRLSALGATAALFDDRSAKVLYVSPKQRGWLAGASFARDADDESVEELYQAGITHESYRHQNVLRWGATYAHGRSAFADNVHRDLDSFGAGASVTLNDSLTLGLAATFDGPSGLPAAASGRFSSDAWGATASANYNSGPWTIGAWIQYARAEGDVSIARDAALAALQIGASYRFATRLRLYGAWYRFDFDDDDRSATGLSATGNVLLVGFRVTL